MLLRRLKLSASAKELLSFGLFVVVWAALLHLTGIGCPIHYFTGVSCPGCGMTRAWLSALHLQLADACAYHPLFWLVPIIVVMAQHSSSKAARRGMAVMLVLLLALWVVRLCHPDDLSLLPFSHLHGDVVQATTPQWLPWLLSTASAPTPL